MSMSALVATFTCIKMAQSLGETEINQRQVSIYHRPGSYSLEDKLVEAADETIQVSRGYPFSFRLVFLAI